MPMPQLPRQPWMGQGQQPQQGRPQMPSQQQPQRPGQQQGKAKQTPEQIHAQLDQKEQQLKAELKKVQAVRTLLPELTQQGQGQPQQGGQRPQQQRSMK
jgi:hypothetical protein